ncbi:DUF2179 domain-containing protein [Mycoplasma sp. Mirounga ES2805-ORL]|uniref:DUF2179 domain-containing protein n=1 Tax=Mycoplasma sp. Mirounga ES2805-ORL TaxID=754514 RepID=UPI00197B610D|nr:YitT family protein [Mycoplasma sp. Mirounga ES2805-ORL]QSF13496.1 YitT family protein [Mycoplasma sp. Mirounga ES2805-ORL]
MKENKKNKTNTVEIQRVKIKQSLFRFSSMHRVKNFKYQVLFTVLIGIFMGLTQFLFVQITGLYEMGIAALCQSVARLTYYFISPYGFWSKFIYNLIFWGLNVLVNIPLFILSYKKINQRFAILTVVFMIAGSVAGFIISNIPSSDTWLLFGKIGHQDNPEFGVFAVFIYAFIWGLIQAVCTALLLMINSSSGGFDMLSVYLSQKKYKDVGIILMFLHLGSFIIAFFLGTYLPGGLHESINISSKINNEWYLSVKGWSVQKYFSPSFIAGLFMVLFNGWLLSTLFPKFKMVRVEVMSSQTEAIVNKINSLKSHKFTSSINTVLGGYSKQEQKSIIVICLFMDAPKLFEIIREVDPNAFITASALKKVEGYLFVSK